MISATTASSSISEVTFAAVRSKYWRSRLRPPISMAAPITSRMLPRMEPISEALTTSCSPSLSAKKAMMSSGALPNVTLRNPPMPGPERAASSSVARPISAAVGMTPAAEVRKITVADACISSRTIAIGMKGTSRYGQPVPLRRKRRRSNPPEGAPAVIGRRSLTKLDERALARYGASRSAQSRAFWTSSPAFVRHSE